MSAVLNQFNGAVESIPFYGMVSGVFEDKVGEKYKTKDPFYEEIPKKDPSKLKKGEKMPMKQVRRQPPPNITPEQRKLWKKIMKRAWYHDRNFCGCMPISLGLGMITIVSIFPFIGSAIAYKMHYKLIKMCHQAGVPNKLKAEMVGNIGVDFMKTLIPLLGVLLSWVQASSTKNAALFDTWLRRESMRKEAAKAARNNTNKPQGQVNANANTQGNHNSVQNVPNRSQNEQNLQTPEPPAPAMKRGNQPPRVQGRKEQNQRYMSNTPGSNNVSPQQKSVNSQTQSQPRGSNMQNQRYQQGSHGQEQEQQYQQYQQYQHQQQYQQYQQQQQYLRYQQQHNSQQQSSHAQNSNGHMQSPPRRVPVNQGSADTKPRSPDRNSMPRKPVPSSPEYNANEANFRIPPAGYDVGGSINSTPNGPYRKPVGSN